MVDNDQFKFINPGTVKIHIRLADETSVFRTDTEIWQWEDGGIKFKIDWTKFNFQSELKELLKAFIYHRLEVNSPYTVGNLDTRLLKSINKSVLSNSLPWKKSDIKQFLRYETQDDRVSAFRMFYHWAIGKSNKYFTSEIYHYATEFKSKHQSSYEAIFLRQNTISEIDEFRLLSFINSEHLDIHDRLKLQRNVILHLAYELAPRAIQIYSISQSDLIKVSSDKTEYYSIALPMAKKIRSDVVEKRPRSISTSLGKKIEMLVKHNQSLPQKNQTGLFLDPIGFKRVSSEEISKQVSADLKQLGFKKGDTLTLLRHHLAQSLADQGASAEVIAEILGHNSTVPARAYVGATPEIANIKTRALAKNGTYLDIMKMLITGEIIEKEMSPKERWVKGMIGSQYVGGIGSCGLPNNTSCPKNPVFSCYTCNRFHPFVDGNHAVVKQALEEQAQYFIDTADHGLLIESNRAVSQLEITITAVASTIERCLAHKSQPNIDD